MFTTQPQFNRQTMESNMIVSAQTAYKIGFSSAINIESNVIIELKKWSFAKEKMKRAFVKAYYEGEKIVQEVLTQNPTL